MEDVDVDILVGWFRSNGGYIDTKVMSITEFPGSGRGGIALSDIPEGHTLFTLPRTITLSTRTSPLPSLFGLGAWHAHRLHKGWVGLILCMMWEDAWAHELDVEDRGSLGLDNAQTKWGPYMRTLPTTFDTPIFWSADELEELQGTAVIGKIGRDDAERAYSEQLIPAIRTSPTLFPPSHHDKWYTLDSYHRAGSRILSRSFTVSRWTTEDGEDKQDRDRNGEPAKGESNVDEVEDPHPKASIESPTHADKAHRHPSHLEDTNGQVDSDSDSDDDEDDPSDVAMVPMADILNARWGSENAKLFYEPLELHMVTTKNIKQGEQIFNTYGDLPNSDLLRRYGYVDLVRLPSSVPAPDEQEDVEMTNDINVERISQLGNPSDIVEIRADLVVRVVQISNSTSKVKDMHERIDWWLDEGEDDTFVISPAGFGSQLSEILPPALISLTRLLILSEPEFKSARSKGKLPKGKIRKDHVNDTKTLLETLNDIFKQREAMYIGGTLEDDEHLFSISKTLSERKRQAVIVRLGEKRILRSVRQALRVSLAELISIPSGAGSGNEKHDTRRGKKGGDGKKDTGGSKNVSSVGWREIAKGKGHENARK